MTTSSATTFLLPSISHPPKLLFIVHSSLPLLKRHRKPRKNYLRPKILKTLPDPFPPDPPFTIPEQIQPDPQPEFPGPDPFIEKDSQESEFLEASVADVVNNVGIGKKVSNFTVFRVGLFLVGAFVFHTVWVFGSGQNGVSGRDDETGVLGLNGVRNGVVGVDEVEMEKKVREIQEMARNVREMERRELKISSKDDVGVDVSRIEKEVNRKLGKLGKGVKKKVIGYTRNVKDSLVSGNVDGVIFNKSIPESPFVSLGEKTEGFRGLDCSNVSEVKDISAIFGSDVSEKAGDDVDGTELLDNVQTSALSTGDLVREESINCEENDGRNTPESLNGNLNGSSSLRSTFDQDPSGIDHEDGVLMRDLKSDKVGHKSSTGGVEIKESVCQTDSWWLTLPYVLAVVTSTGSDDEEANKLYTIKNTAPDRGDSSYVVTFEDRGDATNFCYLLQSRFEDVHDFNTDIFPIPIKELDEAVKSHFMKVVVVKKGQLQLYAGQPLSDVEMELRSLLKQANLQ